MASPATDKEVKIVTAEVEKIAASTGTIKIRSELDVKIATYKLVEIKTVAKDIEKRRKSITDPMNQALKEVNALFKGPADSLAQAEKIIKEAMLIYAERMEKRAEKRAGKIEDQVDSGELDLAEGMGKLGNIKQAPTNVKSGGGSAQWKTTTKIRILNPGLLPPKYFLRERVLEALRVEVEEDVRKKGEEVPAGAESYQERQLAVRTA